MKTKIHLLSGSILLAILGLACLASCKDDDEFSRRNSFLLNGESFAPSTAATYYFRNRDRIQLAFSTDLDERHNSFHMYFSNLFRSAFRYDFGQTDVESQLETFLYISTGGDAGCDIYDLDYSVSTNYLEITYFSEEECVVRGSYDLTFIKREGRRGCNNPRYGDTLHLVSDYFSIDLEGC